MGSREQPPELTLGLDLKGNFNFLCNITAVGAAIVRPLILSGNGTRAYSFESGIAFVLLPVIATFARSDAVVMYWYLWCVLVLIRKVTADRSAHTDFWGRSRILAWLTFGHNRLFEPLAIAWAAYLIGPRSAPLSRIFWFGAFSLALQYRIASEIIRRQREAIRNAGIEASRYM